MRYNHSILAATTLVIPFFLAACGKQAPEPTKTQATSLNVTTSASGDVRVVEIPTGALENGRAMNFMVMFGAQNADLPQSETAENKASSEPLIFVTNGAYQPAMTKISDETFIVHFNGDAENSHFKVLLLCENTDEQPSLSAFLLREESLLPKPVAAPIQQRTNADNNGSGPVFDATNPAHPLHPTNPLNPMNPSGFFAPRPSSSGGK